MVQLGDLLKSWEHSLSANPSIGPNTKQTKKFVQSLTAYTRQQH